jgi:hypothetical protein
MVSTARELLRMSQAELDDLFRRSPPGDIPNGDAQGTAIIFPGTRAGWLKARLARWLAWRGKVFDARRGTLLNKVTPFDIRAIKAKVYRATSWFDGREAIILDYSKTSFVAQRIRDEIREVAPGMYLGQVYWGRTRICNFALAFAGRAAGAGA